MRLLLTLVRKELLLLRRDLHALALLFLMPACFILLMSLAMRDLYATGRASAWTYVLEDADGTPLSAAIGTRLRANDGFTARDGTGGEPVAEALRAGRVQFHVRIPPGFAAAVTDSVPVPLELTAAPTVGVPTTQLFAAALREALSLEYVRARLLDRLPLTLAGGAMSADSLLGPGLARLVVERPAAGAGDGPRPTSVQQNVPAWLVFAMFFVALPLSTTWVRERELGTLTVLRSLGVGTGTLIAGKLVPYLLVNLGQVGVMLAIGVWVVPALGGDALALGTSAAGLATIALATSIAAVSYALLVANLVRTTEQATIVTGAGNLLIGALGGVMVPRLIMPRELRVLSEASPMAWGLEGFLDVLLRGGDVRMVLPRVLLLAGFAVTALLLAGWRLQRPGSTVE